MNNDLWDKFLTRLKRVAYEECGVQGYTEMDVHLAFDRGKLVGWSLGRPAKWEPAHMAQRVAACREGLTMERE